MDGPPEAPLLPITASAVTDDFFRSDASIRLRRLVELSVAWWLFASLLYFRLLTPHSWTWAHLNYFWVLIFIPLFLIDLRNIKHTRYLRDNSSRLSQNEYFRYAIVVWAELIFKVLLCVYLAIPTLRSGFHLQFITIPYSAGYVMHFLLGHWASPEDTERAEGCNTIGGLVSELARFFMFIFIISVTLKVEKISSDTYNWQAAFWPLWGLEGVLILLLILLTPITLVSIAVDRPRLLMLTWIVFTAGSMGICSFMAMYNMSKFLDYDRGFCTSTRCEDAAASVVGQCDECRSHISKAMIPFLICLPMFAVVTHLLKARLVRSLHDTWFNPAEGGVAHNGTGRNVTPSAILPPPVVMFRVSATYYRRECDPHALDLDLSSFSPAPNFSLQSARHAWGRWVGSMATSIQGGPRTMESTTSGSLCRHPRQDPYASYLSALGSSFNDIVEESNVCGICFDSPPEAALLECGHAGYCMECAQRMQASAGAKCPTCRQPISNIVRLRPDLPVPKEFFTSRPPSLSSFRPNSVQDREGSLTVASASQSQATLEDDMLDGRRSCGTGNASFDTEDRRNQTTRGSPSMRRKEAKERAATKAANEAVQEAIATADEIGKPLARPPWPHAAGSFAVMVDAVLRPQRVAWWLLIFRRGRFSEASV